MSVFDIVHLLADRISVRDLYCMSATCLDGRIADANIRNDNFYMGKILQLYGVDKFKHHFDKPDNLFFTRLYRQFHHKKYPTPRRKALAWLTKACLVNITMFVALGLRNSGYYENIALINSLFCSDPSLLSMMLKEGSEFIYPSSLYVG